MIYPQYSHLKAQDLATIPELSKELGAGIWMAMSKRHPESFARECPHVGHFGAVKVYSRQTVKSWHATHVAPNNTRLKK